jgi:hypothetical protein
MKFTWIAWSAIEGLSLKVDGLGFGSERRLKRITGGKNGVEQIWLEDVERLWSIPELNHFYPVIEGAYVNTKKW